MPLWDSLPLPNPKCWFLQCSSNFGLSSLISLSEMSQTQHVQNKIIFSLKSASPAVFPLSVSQHHSLSSYSINMQDHHNSFLLPFCLLYLLITKSPWFPLLNHQSPSLWWYCSNSVLTPGCNFPMVSLVPFLPFSVHILHCHQSDLSKTLLKVFPWLSLHASMLLSLALCYLICHIIYFSVLLIGFKASYFYF